MANFTPVAAAIGGALIGLSAGLLMLLIGRIAGISGIFGGCLGFGIADKAWRGAFIAGLILARAIIDATEKLTGCAIERAYVDKGYRGHDAVNPRRVFISGQKRGVSGVIKRELRRRSAIEAVIGHMKNEGHLGRCYLKGRAGDAANVILTAVGYNLRLVLAWLRALLRLILDILLASIAIPSPLKPGLLTADLLYANSEHTLFWGAS